jgi:peptidoglycan/xylan/chitin deacetylase (PgdA/CDA1 family)
VSAISLTFDDALPTHLANAGPILKKHHLHGTFFVITGSKTWAERPDDWRRLAAEGNEIGSHTVNHPCLLDNFKPNARDYTAPMIRAELADSARAIVARLGTERGLTFAYPCCNMTFGPPADQARNQAIYLGMVAEYYFAARADNAGMPMNPPEMNPLTVTGLSRAVGVDYPALLAMLQTTLHDHQWGVYTFHGIGGDGLATSAEALDALAHHLEEHGEIWCATFGDAVRYILERKALAIRATKSDSRQVEFELSWPLDAKTYDLPLTLQWQAPSDWTAVQCEADGHLLAESSGPQGTLVDVPAQTKVLRFEALR